MSDDPSQVVVTARSVSSLLTGNQEVVLKAIHEEVAKEDEDLWAVTAQLGALAKALKELETETRKADPEVFVTARNQVASLLQSLIAEGEFEGAEYNELPPGGLEIKFEENMSDPGWVKSLWNKLKTAMGGGPEAQKTPSDAIPAFLPNELRLAVFGDWGTGMYGAPETAKVLRNDPRDFQMLLHLGDVYYSGTRKEVRHRFCGFWPQRTDAISRALNGNHEMYSGGKGYFRDILPAFGQESSYFAFQNDFWTLVGLDLAYVDHDIDDAQLRWLNDVIAGSGDRQVVLFSHHQPFAHFSGQGSKVLKKLKPHFDAKRITAYYWGHIHRCVLFNKHPQWGLYGRCVGHGGIPYKRERKRAPVEVARRPYGWRRLKAKKTKAVTVPSALFLDGPNEFVRGKEEKFGPQGHMVLEFSDDQLHETVTLPDGTDVWSRRLV